MADTENTPGGSAAASFDFQALAARAHADNPDAALLDAIERDKTRTRRFRRMMQACRGRTLAELRGRLANEIVEDGERLAAIRPATLEGLLAKLRHAADKMHRAPINVDQHSALLDAIAWLDPPQPKRRRAARPRSASFNGRPAR